MGDSIVFISKPSVIHCDLPQTKPENFFNDFCFEISKPVNAVNTALMIELNFNIYSTGTLKAAFEFTTHSVCEIETKHSESENYMLLHRAMKIVVDNYREIFTSLDLDGYTDDVASLFPYPKYEVILPVFREIFNPVVGLMVN
jgi:hypothetical protein